MKAKFHLWGFAVGAFLFAGAASAQGQSKPLATVNGESITDDQVQKAAAPALERLESKRQQFLVTLERDKKAAVEDALEEIVNDKLLAAEAKKRNISVSDLVQQEVDNKVAVPNEEAVRKFYDDNKAVINGSFIETALQIRNYLMEHAHDNALSALLAKLKKDYGYKSLVEPDRMTVQIQGHPSKGPADAPVTIVEFSDFECPFCGGLFPTLKKVEEDYKEKVRIVYRQFPLNNLHPHAQKAAEASLCANEQNKFWQLHDAMFTDQQNLTVEDLKSKAASLSLNTANFATCLDSGKFAAAIRESLAEGNKVGVDGTPALFINGRYLGGNQPYDEIAKIIEDELLRAGK
jgi:protein-disulfide isomerase